MLQAHLSFFLLLLLYHMNTFDNPQHELRQDIVVTLQLKLFSQSCLNSFLLFLRLRNLTPGSSSLDEEKVEMNLDMIEKIVSTAASLQCPVLVHAEDYQMCSCGIREAKEKKKDGLEAWSDSRSVESEIKSIRT